MMVLVTYDIDLSKKSGAKRLRRVAKVCTNYGQRVQYSVFECSVDPAQWVNMRQQLVDEIDEKKDSLRFYFLGSNWKKRVEHIGAKEGYDVEGTIMV